MKRYLLPLLMALVLTSSAQAQQNQRRLGQDTSRFEEELNERDFDALKNFLKTKRAIDLEVKAPELTLSGDVRFEWRHLTETLKLQGRPIRSLRGGDATTTTIPDDGLPISRNDFDAEFNFRIDYDAEKTWATAHVSFDNGAGVDDNGVPCRFDKKGYHGSGFCNELCLKKAFFGYTIYECGSTDLYVELGRRNLYNVFDSKIQFLSRFDGIYLHYDTVKENIFDFYWSLAGFVVDERVNQFAWAVEFGFLDLYDSGFDIKYSLIDWKYSERNRCFASNPRGFSFVNSQVTLAYNFEIKALCNAPAIAFGAFLYNHAGQKRHFFKRNIEHAAYHQNKAWYAGIIVGEVEKEGDWSFEVRYEYVQAFAVPDEDASGICNGNVLGISITQRPDAVGNTNYQGWRFEGLYALTDNITIDAQLEWSHAIDTHITPIHNYSKFELETIYAF